MGSLGTSVFGSSAGGHFGQAGGFGGTGLDAPKGADLQQSANVGDVQNAQYGATNSLAAQQKLLAALQSQGGLNAQKDVFSNIGGTADMYKNIANGTGPNPAMAMLNNTTGQNVANQAALMAGQRGAGANVGLLARQAGQQGAATQQQAVGQGANLMANQQLNALSGLTAAQQAQGALANTMAGQQINQANANTQANLSNQQQLQNSLASLNQAAVANQGNVTAGNTSLQNAYIGSQEKGLDNFAKYSSGAGAGAMMGAEGGEVKMAEGGNPFAEANPYGSSGANPQGPQSSFGQYLAGQNKQDDQSDIYGNAKNTFARKPKSAAPAQTNSESMAGGDSSGVGDISAMAAEGGLADGGGHVKAKAPAQKAVASGDDYANDKIPAKLSEGEIVLPRSVTMSKDPVNSSAKFVAQVLAKRRVKR